MGLLDKVKNIFTEEVEDDDVKVEQIQKEVTHVSIESPAVNRNTRQDSLLDDNLVTRDDNRVIFSELDEVEAKTKKPVLFDDHAFDDLGKIEKKENNMSHKVRTESRHNYNGGYDKNYSFKSYGGNTAKSEVKKVFTPTPIISPIYGILDKNYHKEDIVEKRNGTADGLSVDSIRNKAYGKVDSKVEEDIFKNSILFNDPDKEVDNDVLSGLASDKEDVLSQDTEQNIRDLEEITMDLTKELDNLLSKKDALSKKERQANENDNDALEENDLFDLIDSMYEEGDDKNDD